MDRRSYLCLLVPAAFLLAALTPSALTGPYAGKIGIGLEGIGGRGLEFVDAAKTLRPWEGLNGEEVPLDEHGWPLTDAKTVFFDLRPTFAWAPPIDDPDRYQIDVSGTYKLSFKGRAVLSSAEDPQAFRVENQVYDEAADRTTADIVLPKGKALLFMAFSGTKRGIRDVKLIRPGYPAETEQIFTDAFLKALSPFSVLRFMDWLETNNNNPKYPAVTGWAERKLPTDATQRPWGGKKDGAAWEYVIALGNEARKDIWINIPVAATDGYVRQLALMLKQDLRPESRIYVEYSNEVWNGLFGQSAWNVDAALKDPDERIYRSSTIRIAKRLAEIVEIFGEIFGPGSINARIRPVLAGWLIRPEAYEAQLKWIEKHCGPPRDFLYGIASAPYFNDDLASARANPEEILKAMGLSVDSGMRYCRQLQKLAEAYGVKNLCYEGGSDTGGGSPVNVANRIRAERDPRIKDVIHYYLRDNWFAMGGDIFMWFTLTSAYSRYGCWGLTDDVTCTATPKYQAILDLIEGR